MQVYNLIEVANVHGGDLNYMNTLIEEFKSFKGNFGMKFQPFKYDELATPGSEWYEVYKKLFFTEDEWKKIIKTASETKDIWIEVDDSYSINIIKQNLKLISGLKFQSSAINNYTLIKSLSDFDLSKISVILNISSFSIEQIEEINRRFSDKLSPKEIILQIGFQSYPTEFQNSGLSKIRELKKHFQNKISFTEHLDGSKEESIYLPIIAAVSGAEIIEKHVMLSNMETKYDYESSVVYEVYKKYVELQKKYLEVFNQPFINEKELEYMDKTLHTPLLCVPKSSGQLINVTTDLDFKRSGKNGLNVYKINELVESFHILSRDKQIGEVLQSSDFKKAKIATIVAARLKSTRLKRKALLKIGKLSSIELCLKNLLGIKEADYTILATSDLDEDAELENYKYSDQVIFHKGDPVDVIDRYLGVIDKYEIDVIIRQTGDNPFSSSKIASYLLKSHFSSGADFTTGRGAALGTNLDIINTQALKKIKTFFPVTDFSEYMSCYFTNNPGHFKLNIVDLPDNLARNYRLTFDYPNDHKAFCVIQEYFEKNNLAFDIEVLFDFLDNHPEVVEINRDSVVKYETDQELIDSINRATTIN